MNGLSQLYAKPLNGPCLIFLTMYEVLIAQIVVQKNLPGQIRSPRYDVTGGTASGEICPKPRMFHCNDDGVKDRYRSEVIELTQAHCMHSNFCRVHVRSRSGQ